MSRDKRPRQGADEGFTLIETLVAFMILAVSLTILLQSIGQATTQIRTSDEAEAIRQLGERTMAAAQADTRPSVNGTDKDSGLWWRWSRIAIQRQDASGNLNPVALITVEIGRPSQEAPVQVLKTVGLAEPKP